MDKADSIDHVALISSSTKRGSLLIATEGYTKIFEWEAATEELHDCDQL